MTDTLTHATTRPQPEAWALASGHCPVICSDTRPDIARIGELIGIHAAQRERPTPEIIARAQVKIAMGDPHAQPVKFTYGALVGVARLKGVIREDRWGNLRFMLGRSVDEPLGRDDRMLTARIRPWWRPGTRWGLLLDEVVALSEPIPMRGAGGLWRLPEEVHEGRNWGKDGDGRGPIAQRALEQWRKGRAVR